MAKTTNVATIATNDNAIANGSNGTTIENVETPQPQPQPETPQPVEPYKFEPQSETLSAIRANRATAKRKFATANENEIDAIMAEISDLNAAEKTEIAALTENENKRIATENAAKLLQPMNDGLNAIRANAIAPNDENTDSANKFVELLKTMFLGGKRATATVATATGEPKHATGDATEILAAYKQLIASGNDEPTAKRELEKTHAKSTVWHVVNKFKKGIYK